MMTSKKLFSLEFNFRCSPQLLFQYLSTPSGLSEWFADDVNSRGEDFTFMWEDSEEYAKLLSKKNNELVKFMWINDEEDYEKYCSDLPWEQPDIEAYKKDLRSHLPQTCQDKKQKEDI